MKQCRHKREGIVTNQPDEYDEDRPLASRACCSRPSCVDAAISWAAGKTNETAYWVPDPPGLQPMRGAMASFIKERKND